MTDKKTAHKRWMKLDNAAKIYPAAKRRRWKALFRLSATLTETVDPAVLEEAQHAALARFPGFATKLKKGAFWYYMEHNEGGPPVEPDGAYPCPPLNFRENNGFMFRVRYHGKRIAVEIFHALTDGSGGLCFLKTLVAEYLRIRYGADIPRDNEILDCTAPPTPGETEDAYLKYARDIGRSRREPDAYYLKGTRETDGYIHSVTGMIPVDEVLKRAKEKQVSLTEYLTAALIMAVDKIQRRKIWHQKLYKPVKVCVPINLRQFYPTNTMRNFASYVNPGIDPRYGQYDFDEALNAVHHYMRAEVTEKLLNAKISTNVRTEKHAALRLTPLFLKNIAMKWTFARVGDRKSSTSISNLGLVRLPDEMARYVARIDFLLGPLSRTKVACGALSYQGVLYLNFTRTIRESVLEREFFRYLVRLGIPVKVESNDRW